MASYIGNPPTTVIQLADGEVTNAKVNATAAIDTTKLADGSISNTEFQYLDGVSSDVQTQIDAKPSTGKAIAMSIVFG